MFIEALRQSIKTMKLNPARLGATLYVPCTRTDLLDIARGIKYRQLRSVVFDLEDAVLGRETSEALGNLQGMLEALNVLSTTICDGPLLFVRPRNALMLQRISEMIGFGALNGFVIPKATAENMPHYISCLVWPHHAIMPTIETREAFDPVEMRRLREQLIAIQDRVLAIRIGGNDLLQTLGCRRSNKRTPYEWPLGKIISTLVSTFVPWGFTMSAPVLENFQNAKLLQDEIDQDIEHGLMTKTAIHPDQVEMIQRAYMVDACDYADAITILNEDAPAVFASDGVMSEPATHRSWAIAITERARLFGIRHADVSPLVLVG